MTKRLRVWQAFALAAAVLCSACAARALDVEDVENLLRNQVGEEIILNMVASDGSLYITEEEAASLRGLGASETLISAMRPRATTTAPAMTTTVQTAPQTVIVDAEPAAGTPVTPVAITMTSAYPPRYDKEGWLSIANHDWQPYYVNIVAGDKRIFISRTPNGGMAVQSGQSVVVNLRKNTYKTYGDSGRKLEVKVRDGEATTLDLNPFGVVGNSGLTGVARDRQRVRSETLFENYVPPPAVIVQEAPPVIIQESPVYVVPGPRYRRYGPPHYRPYRGDDFHFRYHSW